MERVLAEEGEEEDDAEEGEHPAEEALVTQGRRRARRSKPTRRRTCHFASGARSALRAAGTTPRTSAYPESLGECPR